MGNMNKGNCLLRQCAVSLSIILIFFQILEGYGQTESHAISNLQLVGDYSSGDYTHFIHSFLAVRFVIQDETVLYDVLLNHLNSFCSEEWVLAHILIKVILLVQICHVQILLFTLFGLYLHGSICFYEWYFNLSLMVNIWYLILLFNLVLGSLICRSNRYNWSWYRNPKSVEFSERMQL